jgi:peroxiredoxin
VQHPDRGRLQIPAGLLIIFLIYGSWDGMYIIETLFDMKRRIKLKRIIVLVFVLALASAACRSGATTPVAVTTAAPVVQNNTPVVVTAAPKVHYNTPVGDSEPTANPDINNNTPIGPELNNIAPNFSLKDTHGNTYELWELRGHPVLVRFWATWCGYCLEELPAVQALYDRYQDNGLIILGVNGDGESLSKIEAYQNEHGVNFPLLVDIDQHAYTDYKIDGFPISFFIDTNGVIQHIQNGSTDEQSYDNILTSTILVDDGSPAIDLSENTWSVDITEADTYNFSSMADGTFTNFTVQTDVKINNDVYEYHGLFLRQQDEENFYSFRITPDGFFTFEVWHSGDHSFDTILGPTRSEYIHQGVGQVNTLKVAANNEKFDLYINGQNVGSVTDTRFQSGKVGVISCTCNGKNPVSATYSNFSVVTQP